MERSPVSIGPRRNERADAAKNREHLLEVAQSMITELGVDAVTMDNLADRAGLGKGTVFRRFGSRAGIFQALLDLEGRRLQEDVMTGPPPIGPGGDTKERLVAYGRANITLLVHNHAIARLSQDPKQPRAEHVDDFSRLHIRSLLGQAKRDNRLHIEDLDTLTMQLLGALNGPLLLYIATTPLECTAADELAERLANGWNVLIKRIFN